MVLYLITILYSFVRNENVWVVRVDEDDSGEFSW